MRRLWIRIWLIGLLLFMILYYFSPVSMASQLKGGQITDSGEGGCTAFAVTGIGTYDGLALIGNTSDNNWMMRPSLVYRVPEKGYRYMCAEIPMRGMIRAMNEKGFCFLRNGILPDKKWRNKLGTKDGIDLRGLCMKFATECATVDNAIRILETTPRDPSLWQAIIVADAKGKCAILEISPDDFEVIKPDENGWMSITNFFISPKMKKYDTEVLKEDEPKDPFWLSSGVRYNRTLELIKSVRGEKADPYTLMKFLSDTKNLEVEKNIFNSISSHDKNEGTIFASVMQPALKIFWFCYGPPDGKVLWHEGTWGHFVPFAFPQLEPGQYVTEDGIVSPEYPFPYAREHLRLRPLGLFPLK